MIVQHNLLSNFTQRELKISTGQKAKSTEKLSSGYRINRSADDAAGLSISEKMRWNIRGLEKASNNIMDGVSLVQVADGALGEVHAMLDRMKELTVQAANDTNTSEDRQQIQLELDQIKKETERIFTDTEYNTMPVFRRKFNYVEYEDTTFTKVIGSGTVYPDGNNYGLVAVMNQNGNKNITTDDHLSDRVKFSGDGWISSGNRKPEEREILYQYNNDIDPKWDKIFDFDYGEKADYDDYFKKDWGYIASGETKDGFTRNGNALTKIVDPMSTNVTHNKNGETVPGSNARAEYTINLMDNGEGGAYATSYTYKIYEKSTGDLISQEEHYLKEYSGSGGIGRENGTYACAYMDFSKLGTDFHINELDGLGFSSTCCHGCGHHYSVQFVDNSDNKYNLDKTTENGIKYSEKWGSSSLIQIDISGISDDSSGGEALTKAIVSATKASSIADNHWEQYAYKADEPGKLYLYENTLNVKSGERSTWEPFARDENGNSDTIEYVVGTRKYVEDVDLHIQSSSLANQAIMIRRPVMSNAELGIETVYVDDGLYASESIAMVDRAIEYVNGQRSYLGAMQNRLKHAFTVDQNTSENTQYSESRIRDTDMAKEMVNYSKHNIVEQVGQNMLAQANQSTQGVLSLLS